LKDDEKTARVGKLLAIARKLETLAVEECERQDLDAFDLLYSVFTALREVLAQVEKQGLPMAKTRRELARQLTEEVRTKTPEHLN
jgi:hypothetical protein